MKGDRPSEQEFEEQWRDWATRPPSRTPRQAAEAVRGRLGPRHRGHRVQWAVAAAAAVILVAAGLALHLITGSSGKPTVVESAITGPSLGPGEVLMWLDQETPLYMTFQLTEEVLDRGGSP